MKTVRQVAARAVWDGYSDAVTRRNIGTLTAVTDAVVKAFGGDTHVIIPCSYLDALTALLDAGDSRGISDGRAAAEHVWQNAENARDAAREEMGL